MKHPLTLILLLFSLLAGAQENMRYVANIELGIGITTNNYPADKISVLSSHGVLLNDNFYIGLGAGVESNLVNHYSVSFPVFIDSNLSFATGNNGGNPYVGARMGAKWIEEGQAWTPAISAYFGWQIQHLSLRLSLENLLTRLKTNSQYQFRSEQYASCGILYAF